MCEDEVVRVCASRGCILAYYLLVSRVALAGRSYRLSPSEAVQVGSRTLRSFCDVSCFLLPASYEATRIHRFLTEIAVPAYVLCIRVIGQHLSTVTAPGLSAGLEPIPEPGRPRYTRQPTYHPKGEEKSGNQPDWKFHKPIETLLTFRV